MVARVKTGINEVDRALEPVWKELNALGETGVIIAASLTAATPFRFAHGLGRPWRGWVQTRTNTASPLFEVNTTTTNRAKELWLQCASDAQVEVFIF